MVKLVFKEKLIKLFFILLKKDILGAKTYFLLYNFYLKFGNISCSKRSYYLFYYFSIITRESPSFIWTLFNLYNHAPSEWSDVSVVDDDALFYVYFKDSVFFREMAHEKSLYFFFYSLKFFYIFEYYWRFGSNIFFRPSFLFFNNKLNIKSKKPIFLFNDFILRVDLYMFFYFGKYLEYYRAVLYNQYISSIFETSNFWIQKLSYSLITASTYNLHGTAFIALFKNFFFKSMFNKYIIYAREFYTADSSGVNDCLGYIPIINRNINIVNYTKGFSFFIKKLNWSKFYLKFLNQFNFLSFSVKPYIFSDLFFGYQSNKMFLFWRKWRHIYGFDSLINWCSIFNFSWARFLSSRLYKKIIFDINRKKFEMPFNLYLNSNLLHYFRYKSLEVYVVDYISIHLFGKMPDWENKLVLSRTHKDKNLYFFKLWWEMISSFALINLESVNIFDGLTEKLSFLKYNLDYLMWEVHSIILQSNNPILYPNVTNIFFFKQVECTLNSFWSFSFEVLFSIFIQKFSIMYLKNWYLHQFLCDFLSKLLYKYNFLSSCFSNSYFLRLFAFRQYKFYFYTVMHDHRWKQNDISTYNNILGSLGYIVNITSMINYWWYAIYAKNLIRRDFKSRTEIWWRWSQESLTYNEILYWIQRYFFEEARKIRHKEYLELTVDLRYPNGKWVLDKWDIPFFEKRDANTHWYRKNLLYNWQRKIWIINWKQLRWERWWLESRFLEICRNFLWPLIPIKRNSVVMSLPHKLEWKTIRRVVDYEKMHWCLSLSPEQLNWWKKYYSFKNYCDVFSFASPKRRLRATQPEQFPQWPYL